MAGITHVTGCHATQHDIVPQLHVQVHHMIHSGHVQGHRSGFHGHMLGSGGAPLMTSSVANICISIGCFRVALSAYYQAYM